MFKILVVDDDALTLESIADVLGNVNCASKCVVYELLLAKNGSEALQILFDSQISIDLVITDISMPDFSGFDILASITNSSELQHIPVILLSANTDNNHVKNGFRKGAVEFIDKPFNNSELIETVAEILHPQKDYVEVNIQRRNDFFNLKNTMREISHINSHETRQSNAKIIQLLEMVKEQELEKEEAFELINKLGLDIDLTTKKIQNLMTFRLNNLKNRLSQLNLTKTSVIWFIDDDELWNMLNKKLVAINLNMEAKSFLNAKKAVELLESITEYPDVIFLDLMMPEMTGFEFLDALRDKGINVPVVVLSSSIQDSDIDKSLTYENVVTYLTKPLKKENLLSLLDA
jgi:CheY-like chemotaxis protein